MTELAVLRHRSRRNWPGALALAAFCGAAPALSVRLPVAAQPVVPTAEPPEAAAADVHRLCAACHAYPPPDTFPRFAWRKEVKLGYDFLFKDPNLRFDYPPMESVVRYYERRAPEALPPITRTAPSNPAPCRFERRGYAAPPVPGPPG